MKSTTVELVGGFCYALKMTDFSRIVEINSNNYNNRNNNMKTNRSHHDFPINVQLTTDILQ